MRVGTTAPDPDDEYFRRLLEARNRLAHTHGNIDAADAALARVFWELAQRQVVHPNESIRITAGPGTGKTHIASYYLAAYLAAAGGDNGPLEQSDVPARQERSWFDLASFLPGQGDPRGGEGRYRRAAAADGNRSLVQGG
jgi:hypothetical protein